MPPVDDSQLMIIESIIISADRGSSSIPLARRIEAWDGRTSPPSRRQAWQRFEDRVHSVSLTLRRWTNGTRLCGGMRDHIHRIRPSALKRRPSPGWSRHRESFGERGMRSWPVSAGPVEGACCDTTAFAAIDPRPPASCPGQTRGPNIGRLAGPISVAA